MLMLKTMCIRNALAYRLAAGRLGLRGECQMPNICRRVYSNTVFGKRQLPYSSIADLNTWQRENTIITSIGLEHDSLDFHVDHVQVLLGSLQKQSFNKSSGVSLKPYFTVNWMEWFIKLKTLPFGIQTKQQLRGLWPLKANGDG